MNGMPVFGQNVDTMKKRAISGNSCSRWWLQVRFYTFCFSGDIFPCLEVTSHPQEKVGYQQSPEFRGYMRQAVNFNADPSEQSFVYFGLCLKQ